MLSLGLNDFLRVPAVGLGRSHPTLLRGEKKALLEKVGSVCPNAGCLSLPNYFEQPGLAEGVPAQGKR